MKFISTNHHRQSYKEFSKIQLFKGGLNKPILTGSEIIYKMIVIYLSLIQSYTLLNLPKIEQGINGRYKKVVNKKTKNL